MPTPRLNEGKLTELDALEFLFKCAGEEKARTSAEQLLRDYGGLFEAIHAAQGVGFSEEMRVLASLVAHAGIRRDEKISAGGRRFADSEAAGRFFRKWFEGMITEQLVVLFLDDDFRAVDCRILGKGSETSVVFDINELMDCAKVNDTQYVIMAHNHPRSSALPSEEDLRSTTVIAWALYACGVKLLDHIVVYDDDYISMSESKILKGPTPGTMRVKFSVHQGVLYYTDREDE